MKKLIFVLALCVACFVQPTNVFAMEPLTVDEQTFILPCCENGGLDVLAAISEKCDDENVTLSSFTQEDFSFMLDFCSEYIDAMVEADKNGLQEAFMNSTQAEFGLTMGFVVFLIGADEENLLNSENHARLESFNQVVDNL